MAAPVNPQPPRSPNSLSILTTNKTVSNLWRPSIFQRVFRRRQENSITPTARAIIFSELKDRENNIRRGVDDAEEAIFQHSKILFATNIIYVLGETILFQGIGMGMRKFVPDFVKLLSSSISKNSFKTILIISNLSLPIIKSITPFNGFIPSFYLQLISGLALNFTGCIVKKNSFLENIAKNTVSSILYNTSLGMSYLTSRFVKSDRRLSRKKTFIIGLNLIVSSYLCSAAVENAMSRVITKN